MKPFRKLSYSFGCGQCRHCRINRVRLWVARMLLESAEHPASAFVTLTYDEQHLPQPPCVSKADLQKFLKRLRINIAPRRIRYYAVGEYGERFGRPHYHLIIFGLSPTEGNQVEKAWTQGQIYMGTAEGPSMGYTAQYVIKRMTKKTDPRLNGKEPEFSLMSQKPGLGHGIVERLGNAYETERGQAGFEAAAWYSETVRLDSGTYPLGTYLKTKLRERLGITKETARIRAQSVALDLYTREMGKRAGAIDAERKAKLSQQNSAIRIKNKRF